MEPQKIGEMILKIRKENHLTQQELANKLGVTYQAVSKWENGKNMPDLTILKHLCEEFNIDLNDFLSGKQKSSKKISKKKIVSIIIGVVILLLIIILLIWNFLKPNDFQFKTLSSNCTNFNISGSIAYNSAKSHIYISEVEYCGGNDTNVYESIECSLYETSGNTDIKIDTFKTDEESTLEDFLKTVTFHIDNYSSTCKDFTDSSIFLQVNALDNEQNTMSYRIPLNVESFCSTTS